MVAEAVAAGRAPAGINLQMLMDGRLALAPDWKDQQLLRELSATVHEICLS